jgi:hypothetical protein
VLAAVTLPLAGGGHVARPARTATTDPLGRAIINAPARLPAVSPSRPSLTKRASGGSASIEGTVTAAGMTVWVVDTFGFEAATGQADDDRRYTITGLYPGSYLVGTDAGTRQAWYDGASSIEEADWVSLAPGAHATGIDATHPGSPTTTAVSTVLSGRLHVGPGTATPCRDARVTVRYAPVSSIGNVPAEFSYARSGTSVEASTDSTGRFTATTSIVPGWYYVMVSVDSAGAYVPLWWNGEELAHRPAPVRLAGDTVRGQWHLDRGARLSVTVAMLERDTLYRTVDVTLYDGAGVAVGQSSAVSPDEPARFSGLLPGIYYIEARSRDWACLDEGLFYPGVTDVRDAEPVTVESASTEKIFLLDCEPPGYEPRGGTLRGRITDRATGLPLEGVQVCAYYCEKPYRDSDYATTGTDGRYEMPVRHDRDFEIGVIAHPDYYLRGVGPTGFDPCRPAAALSVDSAEVLSLDTSLVKGGSAAGLIVDTDGKRLRPLTPTRPSPTVPSGFLGLLWSESGADTPRGRMLVRLPGYRFVGLAPGRYRARLLPFLPTPVEENSYAATTSIDTVIIQSAGTTVVETAAPPMASGSISGTIQAPDGYLCSSVMCFDEEGIASCLAWTVVGIDSSTIDVRRLFHDDLFSPVVTRAPRVSYTLKFLRPGRYAVAAFRYEPGDYIVDTYDWYGGPTTRDSLVVFEAMLADPAIPEEVTWIRVEEGEHVTGIDFGPAGFASPPPAASRKARLSVRRIGRHAVVFTYRLPDPRRGSTLRLYGADGRNIRALALAPRAGRLVWDRRNQAGRPVASGLFVAVLTTPDGNRAVQRVVIGN